MNSITGARFSAQELQRSRPVADVIGCYTRPPLHCLPHLQQFCHICLALHEHVGECTLSRSEGKTLHDACHFTGFGILDDLPVSAFSMSEKAQAILAATL